MPGSVKGVMFITFEDESANANLIVWPSIFQGNRRTILTATMLGCRGHVQNANGVIYLVVEHVADLTAQFGKMAGLNEDFQLVAGPGDGARHGGHSR